jgi:hypothetical protein
MAGAVPAAAEAAGGYMARTADASGWNGTSTTARTLANVVLVSAGVTAAYFVVTRPRLRRIVFTAVRAWLGAGIPAYLAAEIGRAWVESARRA